MSLAYGKMQGMNPSYQQPPYQQPPQMPAPVKSGVPVWVWIIVAFVGVIMLAGVAVVATGVFVAKQVASNPSAAIAKMAELANPNIQVLGMDEATGKVTIKDKESGKTVTISLDELQQGKIDFTTDEGKVSIGPGAEGKTPAWVPLYPGAKQTTIMSSQTDDADAGTLMLEAKEEFGKVKSWYEEQIKAGGYTNQATTSTDGSEGPGAVLIASKNDEKQSLQVMLNTEAEFTRVTITYGSKK